MLRLRQRRTEGHGFDLNELHPGQLDERVGGLVAEVDLGQATCDAAGVRSTVSLTWKVSQC